MDKIILLLSAGILVCLTIIVYVFIRASHSSKTTSSTNISPPRFVDRNVIPEIVNEPQYAVNKYNYSWDTSYKPLAFPPRAKYRWSGDNTIKMVAPAPRISMAGCGR